MTRHVFTFLGTFLVGALIALAARTVTHQPHAEHSAAGHPEAPATRPAPAPVDHSQHAAAAAAAAQPSAKSAPVNSVCAICGMKVDPKLATAEYQGKTIGFGCRMCPPKFKANPDKYGPSYLRNEVIEK
jgi:YHS domain-containing protein